MGRKWPPEGKVSNPMGCLSADVKLSICNEHSCLPDNLVGRIALRVIPGATVCNGD